MIVPSISDHAEAQVGRARRSTSAHGYPGSGIDVASCATGGVAEPVKRQQRNGGQQRKRPAQ